MTYADLLIKLKELSPEQLNKELLALIELEPCKIADFRISTKTDDDFPDHPYFYFN